MNATHAYCTPRPTCPLYLILMPVIRIPHPSDTFIETLHWLAVPLQLLSAGRLQQLQLLQNLCRLHISHADGFFAAIDIGASYYGMSAWSRRYGDFDTGVCGGKCGEVGFEEGAAGRQYASPEAQRWMTHLSPLLDPAQSCRFN